MKPRHFLFALITAVLIAACVKLTLPTPEEEEEIYTKANIELEETIWEHSTGEKFNEYIYFADGEAKFFYGLFDETEGLLRYSDFYPAPYVYEDGTISTSIQYTEYGKPNELNEIAVIELDGVFQLSANGKAYILADYNPADIQEQWFEFLLIIAPWE